MDGTNKELTTFLAHHGVKGMRWGVRKDRDSGSSGGKSGGKSGGSEGGETSSGKGGSSSSSTPKKDSKLEKFSDDKLESMLNELKGLDSLSDAQLSKLTKRMQLEQSYRELDAKRPKEASRADKFVNGLKITKEAVSTIDAFAKSEPGKAIIKRVKKQMVKK